MSGRIQADGSPGVAGRVDDLNKAASNINRLIIIQYPCGIALKERVFVYVIAFGQITTIYDHVFDLLHGERKFPIKPVEFGFMSVKVWEKRMTANMIPMYVCGYCSNGIPGQPDDFIIDVADSKSGINEQTAFGTIE